MSGNLLRAHPWSPGTFGSQNDPNIIWIHGDFFAICNCFCVKWLEIHLFKKVSFVLTLYSPLLLQFSRLVVSNSWLPYPSYIPEFAQTHVHWVSDAIQPSHPLSSPSPTAPNLSQHQSLFQWVGTSPQVAKGLELQLPNYVPVIDIIHKPLSLNFSLWSTHGFASLIMKLK